MMIGCVSDWKKCVFKYDIMRDDTDIRLLVVDPFIKCIPHCFFLLWFNTRSDATSTLSNHSKFYLIFSNAVSHFEQLNVANRNKTASK